MWQDAIALAAAVMAVAYLVRFMSRLLDEEKTHGCFLCSNCPPVWPRIVEPTVGPLGQSPEKRKGGAAGQGSPRHANGYSRKGKRCCGYPPGCYDLCPERPDSSADL